MPVHEKRLFFLVIIIILLLSGCWDRKEINQTGFAVGLGIDKEGDDYLITTQMALPALLEGGSGGDEPPVWVVGGKGRTIFEAIRDVNTRSARKPFWGHLNVIVLGEEVAKDGLIPIVDILSRGQELRRSNYVVVTQGKARDILEAAPKLESISAIFISNLIENRTGQSVSPAVTLNDLLNTLSSSGIESVLPRIAALEQESFLPPKKESKEEPKEEEKPKGILELRGAGIFNEDKLIGWMDEETTRGYLWVREQVKGGIIVLDNPSQEGAKISLEIKSNKCKIVPRIEDGKISVDLMISTNCDFVENTGFVNVEKGSLMEKLNRNASGAITKEVSKAIHKALEKETDFLGIGEVIRVQYPDVWRKIQWSEVFPQVDINVQTEAVIQKAAMTLRPITPPWQRSK
ncbi:MAG: Ger(x)C family spore germination protein, partial [Peptococcales bacterium]|jgi:Ger(x)C family germination protein